MSLERGVCEIFPPATTSPTNAGYPLRMVGMWNPSSGTVGTVVFENVGPLIEWLNKNPPSILTASYPKRDKCLLPTEQVKQEEEPVTKKEEKENSRRKIAQENFSETQTNAEYGRTWAKRYPIDRDGLRNDRLKELVMRLFFK